MSIWEITSVKIAADALQAHFPCADCVGAAGARSMCPVGQGLYQAQLAALYAACAEREAREEGP